MGTIKLLAIIILAGIGIYFLILRFEILRLAKDFELDGYAPGDALQILNIVLPFALIAFILGFL